MLSIHGVISDFVRMLAREIDVRLVLGARQGRIVAQVVGHGLRPGRRTASPRRAPAPTGEP